MISESDRQAIVNLARQYQVTRIVVFGSSLRNDREANDIDLAVDGIAAGDYFQFYADLIFCISKSVDLVDLSIKSKFTELIARDGLCLYDQS